MHLANPPTTLAEAIEKLTELTHQLDCARHDCERARADAEAHKANSTVLNAWQHAFGTTQLSHAIARLEAAERAAKS